MMFLFLTSKSIFAHALFLSFGLVRSQSRFVKFIGTETRSSPERGYLSSPLRPNALSQKTNYRANSAASAADIVAIKSFRNLAREGGYLIESTPAYYALASLSLYLKSFFPSIADCQLNAGPCRQNAHQSSSNSR